MRAYNTVNDIKTEMEILYRNVTGRTQLTAGDTDIVYSAIVDSFQLVLLEYGVSTFKFHQLSLEVDTVADQNYIELDDYIFRVMGNTVRIPAEESMLGLVDEIAVYNSDPKLDKTGIPYMYAYTGPSDPNAIRLLLWPIPDKVYTINMQVLKYPTDTITEFPVYLASAIKNKAKSLACLGLGLPQLQPGFDRAYEEIIAKVKDGYDGDEPKHVQRRHFGIAHRSIESRIQD